MVTSLGDARRPRIACHDWPSRVYRCFETGEYAADFLQGRIRFGRLDVYTTMEDQRRRDGTEGRGEVREWREDRQAALIRPGSGPAELVTSPGEVTRHTELGNVAFICCFTVPPEDAWECVRKSFGAYVVEVTDPKAFCEEMWFALPPAEPWLENALLMLLPAEYTKGMLVPRNPDAGSRAVELAIAQKPPELSYQHEHRIALICNDPYPLAEDPEIQEPPTHVVVNIGHSLRYATLI
jgi:hypothetical protein